MVKLAFASSRLQARVLTGPSPGPGGTFGLVTKLNCLSIVTRGNPHMYASVAISSDLFEVVSCAIFISNLLVGIFNVVIRLFSFCKLGCPSSGSLDVSLVVVVVAGAAVAACANANCVVVLLDDDDIEGTTARLTVTINKNRKYRFLLKVIILSKIIRYTCISVLNNNI